MGHLKCADQTNSLLKINPLNTELNPICHLLALLGADHIFHFSGLRVKGKDVMICCENVRDVQ